MLQLIAAFVAGAVIVSRFSVVAVALLGFSACVAGALVSPILLPQLPLTFFVLLLAYNLGLFGGMLQRMRRHPAGRT